MYSSFSKKSWKERINLLKTEYNLSDEDTKLLKKNICSNTHIADNLIENAISYFAMPLGLVPNFVVNNKKYLLPIATEEASIIAGLIKTNLYLKRKNSHLIARKLSNLKIGQIQIPKIKNLNKLNKYLLNQDKLINKCYEGPFKSIFQRGGSIKELYLRTIKIDSSLMGIIELKVDTLDAMGANTINQVCEFLKKIISEETEENLNLAIVSNYNEEIVEAAVIINNFPEQIGENIESASKFAELDINRAVTNNKGIMNCIDGVLTATGNDTRAVSAAAHAHASVSGRYSSLSKWRFIDNTLHGTIKLPISAGIVGGATKAHPMAALFIKILGLKSAQELSELCAAAGLIQNLAALKTLSQEGIVKGHMNLYIKNLLLNYSLTPKQKLKIQTLAKETLMSQGYITNSDISRIIENL